MWNFMNTLETRKRSFTSALSICIRLDVCLSKRDRKHQYEVRCTEEIYRLDQKNEIKQSFSFWCFSWNRKSEKRRKDKTKLERKTNILINKNATMRKNHCHKEKTQTKKKKIFQFMPKGSHIFYLLYLLSSSANRIINRSATFLNYLYFTKRAPYFHLAFLLLTLV